MKTELDQIMEWYAISLDSHRTMKKIINKNPEVIPQKSILREKSVAETFELIDKAINELNELTIIALVSVFEQGVIAKMKEIVDYQFESSSALTIEVQRLVISQAERARFEDIIDVFNGQAGQKSCGLVKQVYRYRNEIAHPKGKFKPVTKIDPRSAYDRLSEFVDRINEVN